MPKARLTVIVLLVTILSASCRKTYECQCYLNLGGSIVSPFPKKINATYNGAEKQCTKDLAKEYEDAGFTNVKCNLK